VTKPHARGCAGGERSELLAYRLPDRLQRFEAMTSLDSVDAEAFGRAVVDGCKYRDLSVLLGECRSAVSSPQLVRSVGDDGAGVWVLRSHSRRPAGRKQVMFPHESQNSLLPCPYVVVPQAGPDCGSPPHETCFAQAPGGSH
jgi:hypothetical protein